MTSTALSLLIVWATFFVSGMLCATTITTGAERLAADDFEALEELRVGLITNHTAMVGDQHLADAIHESSGPKLMVLFGPEHGIRGDAPAGAKINDGIDPQTGAPVYSLYGATRKPTQDMLENVDLLLFDIQDVGARFYTFISTMGYGMQAAAEKGIPFMVLDRPNPLGGNRVEGFLLEEAHRSFVGLYPIPIVHGMTVGELALMIQKEEMLEGVETLDLRVVQLEGWERSMLWTDLDRKWDPPSPNIPDFETALIYPGACLLEGTTASEGRGTYEPFILVGAPWIDPQKLATDLNDSDLPGIRFEPVAYSPTSIQNMATNPKFRDKKVHGIRHVIVDARKVEPVAVGVHLLAAFLAQAPAGEVFFREAMIDRLAGTEKLHRMLRAGVRPTEIVGSWAGEVNRFKEIRRPYLLY